MMVPSFARKKIHAGRTAERWRASSVSISAAVGGFGEEAIAVATPEAASSARARASRSSSGWRTAEATSAWSSVPTIAVRRKIAAIVQKRLFRRAKRIMPSP